MRITYAPSNRYFRFTKTKPKHAARACECNLGRPGSLAAVSTAVCYFGGYCVIHTVYVHRTEYVCMCVYAILRHNHACNILHTHTRARANMRACIYVDARIAVAISCVCKVMSCTHTDPSRCIANRDDADDDEAQSFLCYFIIYI